jgi:multidrug efflux pump subunit AcrA (membrane-fusion protein)
MAVQVIIFISCIAALSACSERQSVGRDQRQSINAQTTAVETTEILDSLQVPGTLRAKSNAVVSARTMGQVLSVAVREGDHVQKGQLLAEIDNKDTVARLRRAESGIEEAQRAIDEVKSAIRAAEAAVRSAEANRDLALATRKRYDLLRDRRSVSPQEYDEIDGRYRTADQEVDRAQQQLASIRARLPQVAARIKQAEAEAESEKIALEHSRIVSPIDGIVARRGSEPGNLATPGMPIFEIEDPATYELEAHVEESRIERVRLGQTVNVEVDALGNNPLTGSVREISPSADAASRTFLVKLELKGMPRSRAVRSGLFGRAFFPAGGRQGIVVPRSALVRHGGLEGVFIIEGDKAFFRIVNTGRSYPEGVEILSGLSAGSSIVTAPPTGISDGVRIEP